MTREIRTADEVLQEKREERGWDQDQDTVIRLREEIKPLPITEEEYRSVSLLLAKLALYDQDPKLCEMYFDMQRRASYGNGYPLMEEMSEIEQNMWSLGTGEPVEKGKGQL